MNNEDYNNYSRQQLSEDESERQSRRRRNRSLVEAVAIVMVAVLVLGFLVKLAWLMIAAFVIFIILLGMKALHDQKENMDRNLYKDLISVGIVALVFVVMLVAMFH